MRLLVLALVFSPLLLVGSFSVPSYVTPPSGWYSGDTHLHMQFCQPPSPCPGGPGGQDGFVDTWDDPDIEENLCVIRQFMDDTNLNVACIPIWAKGTTTSTNAQVFDSVRRLVDGGNLIQPWSDPGSNRLLVYGIETSGLAVSEMGHVLAMRVGGTCDPSDPGDPCITTDLLSAGDYDCIDHPNDIPPVSSCPMPWAPWPGFDPENDGSGDMPIEAINYLRANNGPDAVFGYAHVHWTIDYTVDPDDVDPDHNQAAHRFDYRELNPSYWPNPQPKCLTDSSIMSIPAQSMTRPGYAGRPIPLPIDVLFRRVDFLEAYELDRPQYGVANADLWWYGAYYKLLNAGQRPSLSAGTDFSCRGLNDSPRTYVYLDPPALTYDAWVDGLVAGRTSIADDEMWFLEMHLGDSREYPIGSQIDLESPTWSTEIQVYAKLHAAASVPTNDEYVQILRNGVVVANSAPGELEIDVPIPVTESCWIAARHGPRNLPHGSEIGCGPTHTAATYVLLNHRPIAVCEDAEYWAIYMDVIRGRLDPDELSCTPPSNPPEGCQIFPSECCATIDDLTMDLVNARNVFMRIRDYAHQDVLPGVQRLGQSTYGPLGPIPLGISGFTSNQRSMFTFNGPSDSSGGVLLVGKQFSTSLLPQDGAEVFVTDVIKSMPFQTDYAGSAELNSGVPITSLGDDLYYQCVWTIPGNQNDVASDVLKVPGLKQPPGP